MLEVPSPDWPFVEITPYTVSFTWPVAYYFAIPALYWVYKMKTFNSYNMSLTFDLFFRLAFVGTTFETAIASSLRDLLDHTLIQPPVLMRI